MRSDFRKKLVALFLTALLPLCAGADLVNLTDVFLSGRYGVQIGDGPAASNVVRNLRFTNGVVQVYTGTGWASLSNSGTNSNHATLDNLDFAGSGHTGFAGLAANNTFSGANVFTGTVTLPVATTIGGLPGPCTSNVVVNLTAAMNYTARQAAIYAIPHDMGGHDVTINFAAGTYTNDLNQQVSGIYNVDSLTIQGPQPAGLGTFSPSTQQTAIVVCTNNAANDESTLVILANPTRALTVRWLCVSNTSANVVLAEQLLHPNVDIWNCQNATVSQCYLLGGETNKGAGIRALNSTVQSFCNTFGQMDVPVLVGSGGNVNMYSTNSAMGYPLLPRGYARSAGGGLVSEGTDPFYDANLKLLTNRVVTTGGGVYVPYAGKSLTP